MLTLKMLLRLRTLSRVPLPAAVRRTLTIDEDGTITVSLACGTLKDQITFASGRLWGHEPAVIRGHAELLFHRAEVVRIGRPRPSVPDADAAIDAWLASQGRGKQAHKEAR